MKMLYDVLTKIILIVFLPVCKVILFLYYQQFLSLALNKFESGNFIE